MDVETKNRLMKFAKDSRHLTASWYYVQRDEYKQLDKIYENNKKETVDILYDMALDTSLKNIWENNSYIFILHYLLLEHEMVKDDVEYLKSTYRKMILEIFSNDKYAKLRGFDDVTFVGFTRLEAENLYRKYVKIETDLDVVKKYKYEILRHEYDRLFPESGFSYIVCILELHTPGERKTKDLQYNINLCIKEQGIETVRQWANLFLNTPYASQDAKNMLR